MIQTREQQIQQEQAVALHDTLQPEPGHHPLRPWTGIVTRRNIEEGENGGRRDDEQRRHGAR